MPPRCRGGVVEVASEAAGVPLRYRGCGGVIGGAMAVAGLGLRAQC